MEKTTDTKNDSNHLVVYRTLDFALAQRLANECLEEILEDGKDAYLPDVINEYWLVFGETHTNTAIGACRLKQVALKTYECHALIRPGYRTKYAMKAAYLAFNWIIDNVDFEKLNAVVPDCFPNVQAFTVKNGWLLEGVDRQSYTKNDNLWDRKLYGLTKAEIQSLVDKGISQWEKQRQSSAAQPSAA